MTARQKEARERMAGELQQLGLYLTSSFVRSGRDSMAQGFEHVLKRVPRFEASVEKYEHEWSIEQWGVGTVGYGTLRRLRRYTADLRAFVCRWQGAEL